MASEPNKELATAKAGETVARAKDHWLYALLGVAISAALFGGGAILFLEDYVDRRIEGKTAGIVSATFSANMTALLLHSQDAPNPAAVVAAVTQNSAIYIAYDKPGDEVAHRWFRRCDHVVVDSTSQPPSVTCFVMRVMDTNFTSEGRQLTDGAVFEDHMISSDGRYAVRKYQIANGVLTDLPVELPGNGEYRDAWWYAFPAMPPQA